MKLRTFVRYDGRGKIVTGSAILAKKQPDVGDWEEILFETDYSSSSRDHGMLAYIAYDKNNNFLPASNILVRKKPKTGRWKQIYVYKRLITTTTTTTTTAPVPFVTFLADGSNQLNGALGFPTEPNPITVDWGDGSEPEVIAAQAKKTIWVIFLAHDYTGFTGSCDIYLTGDISGCLLFSLFNNNITTPPTLTGLTALQYLNLSSCTSFDTADVDAVLTYFAVLFEFCTLVELTNTAVPTPATLLTAQTANPQCTFNVDTE